MASTTPYSSSLMLSASPPPEYKDSVGTGGAKHHVVISVVLRVMLFATSLVAIILLATSKQTIMLPQTLGGMPEPVTAKFNDSPAVIYYVSALSIACFYSIITGILSVVALRKQKGSSTEEVILFVLLDGLMLGIMASATGAAGAISYQGFIGDTKRRSHICDTFSSFCRHIAGSVFVSLLPSLALLLLVWLSVFVLYKKLAKS